jgi:hypothetical protein
MMMMMMMMAGFGGLVQVSLLVLEQSLVHASWRVIVGTYSN